MATNAISIFAANLYVVPPSPSGILVFGSEFRAYRHSSNSNRKELGVAFEAASPRLSFQVPQFSVFRSWFRFLVLVLHGRSHQCGVRHKTLMMLV